MRWMSRVLFFMERLKRKSIVVNHRELYGLHQAPRAWYETLSTYLLDNGFQRGKTDKTLFIRRVKVKQHEDEIFISQNKYVIEILKKFGFSDVKTANTPVETHKPLRKDKDGEDVDEHLYRSMIGSLMYLTSLRPDTMFAVCACARFQVNPKILHLHDVKRIFRYLKGQPKLGLWYPKDSPFDLVAFTDSDYAGASLDRKSTTGAEYIAASNCYGQISISDCKYALTMNPTIYVSYIEQFWSTAKVKTINEETQIHDTVDGKKIVITQSSVRSDLQLADDDGIDCLPNNSIFENLQLMGYENLSDKLTFYKSYFSPQWKYLIHTILQCLSSKSTAWNEFVVTKEQEDLNGKGCHYASSLEAEEG
ncbi:hypothetical protein Tco_0914811 [Tanacetum coccineum]